ncbi:MAG: hypothetical protein F7C33_03130 [Desulfurococcales archaeon]|nr:hypothetical protein [Desulfurococcales archaeon]
MVLVVDVFIKPLTRLIFRAPSPFTAGVHGPGAFGISFSYPYPSTITGALSSIAYTRRLCSGGLTTTAGREYEDHRDCVKNLISKFLNINKNSIKEIVVRTGYLVRETESKPEIYPYIGANIFPTINVLIEKIKLKWSKYNIPGKNGSTRALYAKAIEEAYEELFSGGTVKEGNAILAYKRQYKGIALHRNTKTTIARMLYSIESINYKPSAYIGATIIIKGISSTSNRGELQEIIKFGKRGLAHVEARTSSTIPLIDHILNSSSSSRDYLLVLTTPAIIRNPSDLSTNRVLVIDKESRIHEKLADKLLGRFRIRGEVIYAPKAGVLFEHSLRTVLPGWNTDINRPRMPGLLVPPGTVIYVHDVGQETIVETATEGVGEESDLGWGSVVPIPLT